MASVSCLDGSRARRRAIIDAVAAVTHRGRARAIRDFSQDSGADRGILPESPAPRGPTSCFQVLASYICEDR
jgi:hypothetical protein